VSEGIGLRQRVALGREAEKLLEGDGALEIALDMSQLHFVETWINSTDDVEQKRCHAAIHALSEVERNLRIIQGDGVAAEADLEAEEEAVDEALQGDLPLS